MARIPERIVEQIISAADIVEVIGSFIPLKRRGANYWGLSPFKREKTPSFAVSPQKGIYKDFSSGKGGNVVSFLMDAQGYTYLDAVKYIADKYGISIPDSKDNNANPELERHKEILYNINKMAMNYYHRELYESEEGRRFGQTYLEGRGILQETANIFQIGYSVDSWNAFYNYATKKGYKEADLVELGLIGKSEKGDRLYDKFRKRLIFPLHDSVGNIVGFAGRILDSADKTAKYINSPESVIYHKSEFLYGLYFAKQEIRAQKEAILVEGYTDVISLYQSGIKNVVASSGTSLTTRQAEMLKRYCERVTVLYDGDEAGVKATIRALEILIACNLQVQTLTLPKEHDPDSYVKAYGVKSFREFKETESRDFVNYLYGIESRERDVTSSSFINEYLTNVTKLISLNNDEVQRGIYSSQVSKQLQIPYEIVVSAVSNHTNRKNYIETTQTDVQLNVPQTGSNKVVNYNNPTNYLEPQEKELVRIMLNYYSDGNRNTDSHISILTTLHEELSEYSFSVQHYDKVKSICFNAYKSKSSRLPLDILLDESEEQVKELVLNLLKEKPTLSEKSKDYYSEKDLVFDYDREDSLEKALNLYKLKRIEVLIEENRLKYEGTDDEYEKEMILTTNIKLSEIKKSIAKEYGYVLTPKSFFYKNITID